MKKLFFILSIIISQLAFGQQREIDSLKNLLKTDEADTNKLIHLYRICDKSDLLGNKLNGIKYGNKAIAFANHLIKGNKKKVIEVTAKKYKAKAYNIIGIIYASQGNYPIALKNYFASVKIHEEIGDKYGTAGSYNNIGMLYLSQSNYAEALKLFFSSLKVFEIIDNKKAISACYINIGNIYKAQGNYTEALKIYFAALKIKETLGDVIGISIVKSNIGDIYHRQGNYSEALKNFFACLRIVEAGHYKFGIAQSYLSIGATNLTLNRIGEAKKYFEVGLNLSKELGAKEITMKCYLGLAKVDSITGNYKSQIEHHKLHIVYRDSMDNEESRKKTIQIQMTYDFEKKEAVAAAEHKTELKNQAKIAEEKNRKQKLVTYFVIGGLLLVMVFAVFVFRTLRITRKQKVLIERQKLAVEQHQKEIIDSIKYAKRIQVALLPSNKNIEKNINRLMKDK
jgi:tetratricopeptide (TPR) repeat protein